MRGALIYRRHLGNTKLHNDMRPSSRITYHCRPPKVTQSPLSEKYVLSDPQSATGKTFASLQHLQTVQACRVAPQRPAVKRVMRCVCLARKDSLLTRADGAGVRQQQLSDQLSLDLCGPSRPKTPQQYVMRYMQSNDAYILSHFSSAL